MYAGTIKWPQVLQLVNNQNKSFEYVPSLFASLLLLPPPLTFWTAILIHFLNAL